MKKTFYFIAVFAILICSLFTSSFIAFAEDESYIDASESKSIYFIGDQFDYENVKVMYLGFEIPSTNLTIEGFATNAVGTKTVKLSYKDIQISYKVNVYQKVKEIRLISVVHKTSYFTGEEITVADMKIQLVYQTDDTKNVNVEKAWIKGFDSSVPCEKQTLTIDFGGITTTYDVEIKAIEYPENNFSEKSLDAKEQSTLKKADTSGAKVALIVVWSVGVLAIVACIIVNALKYLKGAKK